VRMWIGTRWFEMELFAMLLRCVRPLRTISLSDIPDDQNIMMFKNTGYLRSAVQSAFVGFREVCVLRRKENGSTTPLLYNSGFVSLCGLADSTLGLAKSSPITNTHSFQWAKVT